MEVLKRKAARSEMAKQERRQEILQAALALYVRKGFFAGSMNELARELGVAKGTLYVYFPSKEGLWLAIVDLIAEQFDSLLRPILQSTDRPVAKIEKLVQATFDYYDENADVCSILIKIWASTDSSLATDMRSRLGELYRAYRSLLGGIIGEGVAAGEFRPVDDPEAAASLVLAMLDGLMVQWITEPSLFDPETCMQAFRSVCLNGLMAGKVE